MGFFCPICMVFCGKSCTITLWIWLSVLTQLITTHPSGDSLTSRPGKAEGPETIKVQAAVFLSFHISTMHISIPELLLQWWYSEFFPVSRRPAGPLTSGFAVSWTLVPGWVLLIRADASAVRGLVSGPPSSESSKSNCSPSSSSSSTSEAPSGAAAQWGN